MTALQIILASDLSPEVKCMALQLESGLQWFGACIDCMTERRPFSALTQSE